MFCPVFCEIVAPAYPYLLMMLQVVQEFVQAADSARSAEQARMQSDGHHPGVAFTFAIQRVQATFQVAKKLVDKLVVVLCAIVTV